MSDSDTCMMILDEGRVDEAKNVILRQGRKKFGPPDESITTKLNVITDLEKLHRLQERLLEVANWQELLDTPDRKLRGARLMRDSDTYMMILEEGEAIQSKKIILRQGQRRFGAPDAAITARFESITELARLDRIFDRSLDVANWQELLDTP